MTTNNKRRRPADADASAGNEIVVNPPPPPPVATLKDAVISTFGRIASALSECPAAFLTAFNGALLREYMRFVVLKYIEADATAALPHIRPSAAVDDVWHAHLGLPVYYFTMCARARGIDTLRAEDVLARDPTIVERPDERAAAYAHTLARYTAVFGAPPDATYWPPKVKAPEGNYQVFVKTLSGKCITILVSAATTVQTFREFIADREGVPPNRQRLVFEGRSLDDGRTLGNYDITKESTIHLQLRLG